MNITRINAERLVREYRTQLATSGVHDSVADALRKESDLPFVLLVNTLEDAMRRFSWVGRRPRPWEGPEEEET